MATQFIKNTLQTVIDWANLSNYSTADTLSFACEKHLEEKTKELKKKQDEQELQENHIDSCKINTNKARETLEEANNVLHGEIVEFKTKYKVLRDAINLVLQSQNEKDETIKSLLELSTILQQFDTKDFVLKSKKYNDKVENAEKYFSTMVDLEKDSLSRLESIKYEKGNIEQHIAEIESIKEQLENKLVNCKETRKTKDE